MLRNLKLSVFLATKDMLNNLGSLVFVSAALGFLFANVLFSRFMLYGFEQSIGGLIPKVSGNLYATPLRGQSYIFDTQRAIDEMSRNTAIDAISPVLEMPCVLEYKGSRIVTMVWGLAYDEKVMNLRDNISEGRYFSGPDAEEIILGKILKRRFKLKIPVTEDISLDDTTKAIFIKEHNIDKSNKEVYRDRHVRMVGVADFRDYIANNSIFMPLDALRNATILRGRSSSIFIRLNDNLDIDEIGAAQFKPYDMDIEVKHWKDRDDYGTDDLVYGFNLISMITFAVSIICAAILVAFIVFYNTQKKRRTTGILRAIGIKGRIFLIFFILEGILFAAIGVVAGTGLYYLLQLYLEANPIIMPFGDLYPIFEPSSYIFATALFLIVSFIASVYYAVKSGRENIIKVIRGD
jgi:ABC-type lipoprotein release transport system permease subunit